MEHRLPQLIVTDGTGQEERAYAAHRENYFRIDEREHFEWLSLAAGYAGLVGFFDSNDRPDGTWSEYFETDEAIVVALIRATRLDGLQAEFDALLDSLAAFPAPGRLRDPRETPPYRLAKILDLWRERLKNARTPAGRELSDLIETLIETRLRASMADLRRSLAVGGQFERADFEREFAPVWFDASFDATATETPADGDVKSPLAHLFGEVLSAAEVIRAQAGRLLPAVLECPDHDPGVALLPVFLRLFEKAQRQANGFTQRHLDFYHDRVLRVGPRPAEADAAFLTLRPGRPGAEASAERGTEFVLGKDARNRERIYRADADLSVSDAVVAAVYTLHFGGSLPGLPASEASGERQDIFGRSSARALLRRLPHEDPDGRVPPGEERAYPPFGASRRGAMDAECAQARIGFAVASQVLALREGLRKIEVAFKLGEPDEADPGGLERRLATLAAAEAQDTRAVFEQDLFIKSFRELFAISVTGAKGWIELPAYIPLHAIVDAGCPKNVLIFRMELPPDAGPIVPYRSEIHGEDYAATVPVMRFAVNHDAYLNPYGLLRDLSAKSCEIRVEAQGCRDLRMANPFGPLSPDAPFQPFGPSPGVGAYWIVGSPEAASKNLTRFRLNLEWSGLPAMPGGFKTYYRSYGATLENRDFKAGLSVLAEGKWQTPDRAEAPWLELFAETRSDTGETVLAGANTLNLDVALPYCKTQETALAQADWTYRPDVRSGFFRLTLLHPPFGFGHDDYRSALTEALIFNARVKLDRLRKPIPLAPCTPTVNAAFFDYGAIARVELRNAADSAGGERFFHLHPLGWEFVPRNAPRAPSLIPVAGQAGNLLIGIRGGETAATLSLLFHLRDDANPDYRTEGDRPRWHYLARDGWKPFEARQIVSDSTRGLQKTGIVLIEWPADLSRDRPAMPKGLAWLRVSANRGLAGYASLISVHAQALRVVRLDAADSDPRDRPLLPAGTPVKARKTLPGIRSVAYIAPAEAGRASETRRDLRTRVSERAKHRNRAIQSWDYERLVLERFPDIGKAKCFPNLRAAMDPAERVRPGHVLIVVLPKSSPDWTPWRMPTLGGDRLEEIARAIAPLASPFARIEVRNPVYERIQVRCTVRLARGHGEGHSLKLVDRALCEYISPWSGIGYRAGFGWRVRRHDIEAHLLSLGFVEAVSGFSLLSVADDGRDDEYRLFDTAVPHAGQSADDIAPAYPWSIPVPLRRHYVRVDSALDPEPHAATLGALEIGSTFILSRR